ncbi:MAG: hypothetical protein U0325_34685 [Polyangiales bacterium]
MSSSRTVMPCCAMSATCWSISARASAPVCPCARMHHTVNTSGPRRSSVSTLISLAISVAHEELVEPRALAVGEHRR